MLSGLARAAVAPPHVQRDINAGALVPVLEDFNPGDEEPLHAIYVGQGTRCCGCAPSSISWRRIVRPHARLHPASGMKDRSVRRTAPLLKPSGAHGPLRRTTARPAAAGAAANPLAASQEGENVMKRKSPGGPARCDAGPLLPPPRQTSPSAFRPWSPARCRLWRPVRTEPRPRSTRSTRRAESLAKRWCRRLPTTPAIQAGRFQRQLLVGEGVKSQEQVGPGHLGVAISARPRCAETC